MQSRLQPVARNRLHDQVVNQLRGLILGGEWAPGTRLPSERELAQRLAVSRGTVRQALAVLETLHLIERRPGSGAYRAKGLWEYLVTAEPWPPLAGAIAESVEMRELLEPRIARVVAVRRTPDDLSQLVASLSKQETLLARQQPIVEEDTHFHLIIAQATGNGLLVRVVEFLHQLTFEARLLSHRAPNGGWISYQGHQRILEAIRHGDPSQAEEAMAYHLRDVAGLIRLATQTPPDSPPTAAE